jgi:hypothetical protein
MCITWDGGCLSHLSKTRRRPLSPAAAGATPGRGGAAAAPHKKQRPPPFWGSEMRSMEQHRRSSMARSLLHLPPLLCIDGAAAAVANLTIDHATSSHPLCLGSVISPHRRRIGQQRPKLQGLFLICWFSTRLCCQNTH